MGAFLEKPIVEKHNVEGEIDGIKYALSSMQGWRIYQEDAHTIEVNFPGLPGTSFYAVFDGHGGKTVSTHAAEQVTHSIVSSAPFKSGDKSPESLARALEKGFFDLDNLIKESSPQLRAGHDRAGSTAVAVLCTPTHFIFANCGDSRALVCRNNQVLFGTVDHKPSDTQERERIKAAGGFIEMGRVCGNLAVSRGLGDFEYKDRTDLGPAEQKVTAQSETTILERNQAEDEFVLLACDGIWDVISNEGAVVFVNFYLERGLTAREIADKLLDYCLSLGSKDNMSVILVLLPGARKAKQDLIPPPDESEEAKEQRAKEEHALLRDAISKVPGLHPDLGAPPTVAASKKDDVDDANATDDK